MPAPYGSEQRARQIAQWAVNVVDHADADFSMTRFPYVVDPFGQSSGTAGWVPDDQHVVWGYEGSDLLLTESLAFHDTRISINTRVQAGRRIFDETNWGQVRLPEGSLFLELFCPRSNNFDSAAISNTMPSNYWLNDGRLNLSAFSTDSNGIRFPVWRVLLLEPHVLGASTFDYYKDPTQRA